MRILILCFATFAAGILAGSIFWPEEELRRDRTRDGARDTRSTFDRGDRNENGAAASGGQLSEHRIVERRALEPARTYVRGKSRVGTAERPASAARCCGTRTGGSAAPCSTPPARLWPGSS